MVFAVGARAMVCGALYSLDASVVEVHAAMYYAQACAGQGMSCLCYSDPVVANKSQRAPDPAAAIVKHSEFPRTCHAGRC